jgi:hypothetical protein
MNLKCPKLKISSTLKKAVEALRSNIAEQRKQDKLDLDSSGPYTRIA